MPATLHAPSQPASEPLTSKGWAEIKKELLTNQQLHVFKFLDSNIDDFIQLYMNQFPKQSRWHDIPREIKKNIIIWIWVHLAKEKKVKVGIRVPIYRSRFTRIYKIVNLNGRCGNIVKRYTFPVRDAARSRLHEMFMDKFRLPRHTFISHVTSLIWRGVKDTGYFNLFVSMSNVSGIPLRDVILDDQLYAYLEKDMDSTVCRLFHIFVKILGFLKRHNCVWGDISTSNIMVEMFRFGDDFAPKFTLFDPCMLEAHYGYGIKADYIAPENVMMLQKDVDMKLVHNDTWACMICLFETVARKSAFFDRDSPEAKVFAISQLAKRAKQEGGFPNPYRSHLEIPVVKEEYWKRHGPFMHGLFDTFAPMLNIPLDARERIVDVKMTFIFRMLQNDIENISPSIPGRFIDWRGIVPNSMNAAFEIL
jgi:serine/threonine protein kinase